MKKQLFIILGFCLILFSCQINQEAKIKNVAQNYLEAVGNYKFEEGRSFVTDSSQIVIDRMVNIVKIMSEEDREKNLPVEITIKQVTIDKDTALVNFDTKSPLYTHNGNVYLIKQNGGKWLVDLRKTFPKKQKKQS